MQQHIVFTLLILAIALCSFLFVFQLTSDIYAVITIREPLKPMPLGNSSAISPFNAGDQSAECDLVSKVLYSSCKPEENSLPTYCNEIEFNVNPGVFLQTLECDPNELNKIGANLSTAGNYEEAMQYFDRALTIDPNNIVALTNKQAALIGLGNYSSANETSTKINELIHQIQAINRKWSQIVESSRPTHLPLDINGSRIDIYLDGNKEHDKTPYLSALYLTSQSRLVKWNDLHPVISQPISTSGADEDIRAVLQVKEINDGIMFYKQGSTESIERARMIFWGILQRTNFENVESNFYYGLILNQENEPAGDPYINVAKARNYSGQPATIAPG